MWQMIVVAVLMCISAVSGLAQGGGTNFSGTWTLDTAKSKLGERARIESMTLTVTQSDKELRVETATKRLPPPADAAAGGTGRGGGMGRSSGVGDGTTVYNLDGKETTVEVDGPMGKTPVKYKASVDGGNVNLSSSRSFSGPMGEVSITTKEIWSISADGKVLTVEREQTSPRGTTATTLVFVKK